MIQDPALRWIVTLLFLFSAGVCIAAIVRNRHSVANLISHSLHAVMAIAMAVMAWPRGAELPARAPMLLFLAAAVWFLIVTVQSTGHRMANSYHALMMLAMAWMYAAMGGLPLRSREDSASTAMPEMAGMGSGHAGHGGHAGHLAAAPSAAESGDWTGTLNWLFTLGFAASAVFWLYRFITTRLKPSKDVSSVGVLCQLAMAAGMAVMFGVML